MTIIISQITLLLVFSCGLFDCPIVLKCNFLFAILFPVPSQDDPRLKVPVQMRRRVSLDPTDLGPLPVRRMTSSMMS